MEPGSVPFRGATGTASSTALQVADQRFALTALCPSLRAPRIPPVQDANPRKALSTYSIDHGSASPPADGHLDLVGEEGHPLALDRQFVPGDGGAGTPHEWMALIS